jgi:phosphate uptake regulator
MKRRVVKHGPSSLIVSLPSKWCNKYSINKGSEVDVEEDENRLIIATDLVIKSSEITVDITGLDRTTIMYCIRGLYRLGYDALNLNFKKPTAYYQRENRDINIISVLHTETNRLIGYEIMKERSDSCVIKDLQESSLKDFDNILRRIFLLLIDMTREFVEAARNKDISLLETMENKHDTITKFVSYCLRILNKMGSPKPGKGYFYYNIISILDRMTDNVKYAARDLRKLNKKLHPAVIRIFGIVLKDLECYYELFYKYGNEKIIEINDMRYSAEKDLRMLPRNLHPIEVIAATNIFHITEMLLDLIEARTALEY